MDNRWPEPPKVTKHRSQGKLAFLQRGKWDQVDFMQGVSQKIQQFAFAKKEGFFSFFIQYELNLRELISNIQGRRPIYVLSLSISILNTCYFGGASINYVTLRLGRGDVWRVTNHTKFADALYKNCYVGGRGVENSTFLLYKSNIPYCSINCKSCFQEKSVSQFWNETNKLSLGFLQVQITNSNIHRRILKHLPLPVLSCSLYSA